MITAQEANARYQRLAFTNGAVVEFNVRKIAQQVLDSQHSFLGDDIAVVPWFGKAVRLRMPPNVHDHRAALLVLEEQLRAATPEGKLP